MITIFCNNGIRNKFWSSNTFWQQQLWHRGNFNILLARFAGIFRADILDNTEFCWNILYLFAYLFTNADKLRTATANLFGFRNVAHDNFTRNITWYGLPD